MTSQSEISYGTFDASLRRSNELERDLLKNPKNHILLTGDRPTGSLHVGHLFGSVKNRVRLQQLGVETFVVIADYQVLTDRDTFDSISQNVIELTLDYLACGLDPDSGLTHIFPHSHVPELNQLLIPFLTLVTNAELDRNPTVKEEIAASGQKKINAGMYTYPVHQAADILFCKTTVVPVGKDQLPHIELTRTIARRFNQHYASGKAVFREPEALLSDAPVILGLDGIQKMSKSRNNAVMLKATSEETANLIKKAKTDSNRVITYDPSSRPEVSNLLLMASLASGESPENIAEGIGDAGSGKLKQIVTERINEYLAPIRKRRNELASNMDYVKSVLRKGISHTRGVAEKTLSEVRTAMNMEI